MDVLNGTLDSIIATEWEVAVLAAFSVSDKLYIRQIPVVLDRICSFFLTGQRIPLLLMSP